MCEGKVNSAFFVRKCQNTNHKYFEEENQEQDETRNFSPSFSHRSITARFSQIFPRNARVGPGRTDGSEVLHVLLDFARLLGKLSSSALGQFDIWQTVEDWGEAVVRADAYLPALSNGVHDVVILPRLPRLCTRAEVLSEDEL